MTPQRKQRRRIWNLLKYRNDAEFRRKKQDYQRERYRTNKQVRDKAKQRYLQSRNILALV
jgi:hypothetical protein